MPEKWRRLGDRRKAAWAVPGVRVAMYRQTDEITDDVPSFSPFALVPIWLLPMLLFP
jgi:hypothetical protein